MSRAAWLAIVLSFLPVEILSGAETASQPVNLSVVLEKALYAEETAGDLDTAGKLYQQVVDAAGANRPLAAQALKRLTMLHLKQGKPAEAQATFNKLKTDYQEQKEIIGQTKLQLAKARAARPAEIVSTQTDAVVDRIATMAEQDPALASVLAELDGLNEKAVVSRLVARLESDVAEQRRAALFILWRGPIADASPATPALTAMLSHTEDFTRGMAAIVLGARKITSAYQAIADMALKDSSSYARRCAVYALGELGDSRGLAVAQQAQADSDAFVKANAKAAVEKLKADANKSNATAAPGAADKKAAENYKAAGWRHWFKQQYPEAEEQFKLAVANDPTKADYWNGLGWSQMNQGKSVNARESFEKAVALDPRAAASWNGLGWIAHGEGKKDDALTYWQKAVEASPSATAALSGLSQTYLEKGDYENAEKYYKQWTQAEPANADARAGFGKVRMIRAAIDQAQTATETMLKDLDAGRYGEAWEQWSEHAKKQLPKNQFEAIFPQTLKPLGKVLGRKRISASYMMQIPGAPDGQYVVMQFMTQFENKKDAVETITPMKDKDGIWRVSGYFIK